MRAADLLTLSRAELHRLLAQGHPIEPEALDDREYRGISLGLPAWVDALTWKKFKKVFHRDRTTGVLRGWNVRMVQNGIDAPFVPLRRGGQPATFGHFRVVSQPARLLLDYGRARLRDPLVALEPGRADLLLGWSYIDLGLAQLPTPSFFSLERDIPLSHIAI